MITISLWTVKSSWAYFFFFAEKTFLIMKGKRQGDRRNNTQKTVGDKSILALSRCKTCGRIYGLPCEHRKHCSRITFFHIFIFFFSLIFHALLRKELV